MRKSRIVVSHRDFANVLIHRNIVPVHVRQALIVYSICSPLVLSTQTLQAGNVALASGPVLLTVATYGGKSIPKSKPKSTG